MGEWEWDRIGGEVRECRRVARKERGMKCSCRSLLKLVMPVGCVLASTALLFAQLEQVWVVEKLFAVWVESVTLSVYFVPLRATEALMLSPGTTVLPTIWMLLVGYISHHE